MTAVFPFWHACGTALLRPRDAAVGLFVPKPTRDRYSLNYSPTRASSDGLAYPRRTVACVSFARGQAAQVGPG
jgi:hypothetical protein